MANVASFTDAWIETCVIRQIISVHVVASFTDAWIETGIQPIPVPTPTVASFTDAWIETFIIKTKKGEQCRIFYRCVD